MNNGHYLGSNCYHKLLEIDVKIFSEDEASSNIGSKRFSGRGIFKRRHSTIEGTSNVAPFSEIDYQTQLMNAYIDGFVMASFFRVPGGVKATKSGLQHISVNYQGVFYHRELVPLSNRSSLKVNQCHINPKTLKSGIIHPANGIIDEVDTMDIKYVIHETAKVGGRLVCVKDVWKRHQEKQTKFAAVEVFINMPLKVTTRYTYNVVNIPVPITVISGFGGDTIITKCDFRKVFLEHLSQGWKLIDIFYDFADITAPKTDAISVTKNTIWFFEKEEGNLNDADTKYEGTVVEFEHKIQTTKTGTSAKMDIEDLLTEMGVQGWQFTCVLETPKFRHFKSYSTQIILFFFQRPVLID